MSHSCNFNSNKMAVISLPCLTLHQTCGSIETILRKWKHNLFSKINYFTETHDFVFMQCRDLCSFFLCVCVRPDVTNAERVNSFESDRKWKCNRLRTNMLSKRIFSMEEMCIFIYFLIIAMINTSSCCFTNRRCFTHLQ